MLKRHIKYLFMNNNGSMVVEVSIAIMIVLGLFIGFIAYTNAMRYQLVMSMAAREGARTYMITYKKYGDIDRSRNEARERAEEELIIGGVPGAVVSFSDKEVRITINYGFTIPFSDNNVLSLSAGAEFHEEEKLDFYY